MESILWKRICKLLGERGSVFCSRRGGCQPKLPAPIKERGLPSSPRGRELMKNLRTVIIMCFI